MPKRRRYVSTTRKRRRSFKRSRSSRKRARRNSNVVAFPAQNISRTLIGRGLPMRCVCRHVYADADNLQIAALTNSNYYTMRANSMYDPYQGALGHQAYLFDQMANLYKNWVVIGSKITFWIGSHGGSGDPCAVSLGVSDDANASIYQSTALTCHQYAERRLGKYKPLPRSSTDWTHPVRISGKFSTKKLFGNTNGIVNANSPFVGTDAANPSQEAYFHLMLNRMGQGTAASANLYIDYRIEYIAVWFDPKTPFES